MGGRDPEHPAGVSWNWLGHFRGLGYPWGFDALVPGLSGPQMGKNLTFPCKFCPDGDKLVTQLLVRGIAMQPSGAGVSPGGCRSLGLGLGTAGNWGP